MRFKYLLLLLPFLVLNCAKDKGQSRPLDSFVGPDAVLVLKINHLGQFLDSLENNDFLTRLEDLEPYGTVLQNLRFLSHLQQESPGIAVLSKSGTDPWRYLYATKGSPGLFAIDSLKDKTIETLEYKDRNITKYTIDNNTFFSGTVDDMVVMSSSEANLNQALAGSDRPLIDSLFKRLYDSSDPRQAATLFVNFNQSDSLLATFAMPETSADISRLTQWVALDIDAKATQLSFNGLGMARDSVTDFLNLFQNTRPLPNVTPSFAPITADAILSYSFDDFKGFVRNQHRYYPAIEQTDSLFNAVEEIGFIYQKDQTAMVLNTYGSERIADHLELIKTSVVDYQGNPIYELAQTDFLIKGLVPLAENFEARYGTILENAFVFTNDKDFLQSIISNYKNGTTFNNGPTYEIAGQTAVTSASILYMGNSAYMEQMVQQHLLPEIGQGLKKNGFSGYNFTAQMVADGDLFLINASAQKIDKRGRIRVAKPMFTVQFDSDIITAPQFVLNHLNKKKELVVQDIDNNLYLVSNTGKILWKKQLQGRIQGAIHQVDVFKNGRLQLAFTTNNQLLVIDRDGNEVKALTKSFEGGNVNPLAVFDYENKREYRLVVTQGTNIFMYDRNGKIVGGFKFKKADAAVVDAPKHFVVGNRDYLVFKLEDGSLKILDRRGNTRTKMNEKIDFSANEVLLYKNQFVATDKNGMLYQIGTNGKAAKTNLNLNKDHGTDAFGNTLVYMNDNVLSIKGKKLELELGVYTKPKIFYINNKIYVTVTDIQNQKVYLFDSLGVPIANFPVFGTSMIDLQDIDNDQRLELAVKEQENAVVVYKID